MPERFNILKSIALIMFFVGLLLVHSARYMPFFADDALISLRYADRLIQGWGLTWTNGPPVEGYSNLMWIFLVAFLGSTGIDLVAASRILGLLGMGAVIAFVIARYMISGQRTAPLFGVLTGLLFFVGVAPVAVWAIGGLEQPLVAAALAGVIPLYWMAMEDGFKNRSIAFTLSFLLGVLCLTRPDGPLFSMAIMTSAALSCLLAKRRWPWSFMAIVVSMPILFYGGQLIFRLLYYGEWLPNTALVKLNPSSKHLLGGFLYVWHGLLALSPVSFLAVLFLCIGTFYSTSRERFMPLILMTLLWLIYLVAIGGDIFPAYRHFVPIIVLFTYTVIEGTAIIWDKLHSKMPRPAILAVCLLVILTLTLRSQFWNPESQRAVTERWEWEGRSLGLTLKKAFADKRPLLAVTAAGCLPYWSELPCLDMLGLNDYYLPRHKPKNIGTGFLGHELGDGSYILDRAPDIIIFNVGSGPAFRSGNELAASRGFYEQYAKIKIQTAFTPEYNALVWLRKYSSRIGIQQDQTRILIPAYLMNAHEDTKAFLYNNHLVVGLDADHPIGILIENVSGYWKIEVVSRHSKSIDYTLEGADKGLKVNLTTKSSVPLPVEAIILTRPATAHSLSNKINADTGNDVKGNAMASVTYVSGSSPMNYQTTNHGAGFISFRKKPLAVADCGLSAR
jgi:arabinofuranosyltransferase